MLATATTERDEYAQTYSCFFKEAWGFRPRVDTTEWTLEDFQAEFRILSEVCEQNRLREAEGHRQAAREFESLVRKLIRLGAADRTAAIRWICQAEGTFDMSYLCFLLGLDYGYFN